MPDVTDPSPAFPPHVRGPALVSVSPGASARGWVTRGAKVAVALVSAAVLTVTGYGWSAYQQLSGGLATSNVVDHASALHHGGVPDATGVTDGAGVPDRASGAGGAADILLVGLDSRTDAHGDPLPEAVLARLHAGADTGELNTDTVILVHLPHDTRKKAVAISLPRDSYVAIPGYGKHKLNSAYARALDDAQRRLRAQGITGTDLYEQARQAGRRSLIQTVEELSGVPVDHYAEVNLGGFYEITQAVGGVQVCLNAPVRDAYSGAEFPAGVQTVQGASAVAFVRQRHGLARGDLDRIVRQQAFLSSLAHQVLSADTLAAPATLSALLASITKYIVLDQGWDLTGFLQQAQGMSSGNIAFQTIPTGRLDLPTPSDGQAVQVDPAQVRDLLRTLGTSDSGIPLPTDSQAADTTPHNASDPPPTQPLSPTIDGVSCVN